MLWHPTAVRRAAQVHLTPALAAECLQVAAGATLAELITDSVLVVGARLTNVTATSYESGPPLHPPWYPTQPARQRSVDFDVEVQHFFARAERCVELDRGVVAEVGLDVDDVGAARLRRCA